MYPGAVVVGGAAGCPAVAWDGPVAPVVPCAAADDGASASTTTAPRMEAPLIGPIRSERRVFIRAGRYSMARMPRRGQRCHPPSCPAILTARVRRSVSMTPTFDHTPSMRIPVAGALAALTLVLAGLAGPSAAGAGTTFGSPLAATVHDFRNCLSHLPTPQSRLLALRSGLGGRHILSQADAATQLGITLTQEQAREPKAAAHLRRLGHETNCGSGQATSTPAPARSTTAPSRTSRSAPTSRRSASSSSGTDGVPASGGWNRPGPLIALGVAAIALVALLREVVRVVR